MTPEECNQLIPYVLEQKFPDMHQHHDLPSLSLWSVSQRPGCVTTVDTYGDGRNPPLIRVLCGIAILIPSNPTLASFVNETNENIFLGNTIMTTGSAGHAVVMRLMIQGLPLSWNHRPSVDGFSDALMTVITQANAAASRLLPQFGGRPFNDDEWDVVFSLA